MPEKSSPTGGFQPMARPVSDQPLAKTVSGEQEDGATREEEGRPSEAMSSGEQETPQAEDEREENRGEEEEKGLLDKIKDKLTGN